MIDRLTSLAVRDFRSIRGPISVSLDAPAVLIHGPNGTGKTSLLSAIELGLTGAVVSLGRFDPDHLAYLPHKLGDGPTQITIATGTRNGDAQADGKAITGKPLLNPGEARFYVERCYLTQATLGRLLEIYEHQDNRRTDSPLTRFVKEMLGLEALDALIDGLNAAGNVTRFRTIAPNFWKARDEAGALSQAVRTAQDVVSAVTAEQTAAEIALRELSGPSLAVGAAVEPAGLRRALEQRKDEETTRLAELAAIRRDVESRRITGRRRCPGRRGGRPDGSRRTQRPSTAEARSLAQRTRCRALGAFDRNSGNVPGYSCGIVRSCRRA